MMAYGKGYGAKMAEGTAFYLKTAMVQRVASPWAQWDVRRKMVNPCYNSMRPQPEIMASYIYLAP